MDIATIIERYQDRFTAQYCHRLSGSRDQSVRLPLSQ